MGDDFSEPVKKVLASRVGNLCSNPECRALTSGPQNDPAKAVNVGVAAHITAASPGGPRYDSNLLPEERSGPGNGIWLCQNDAKLIDNDVARFTVDVLRQWKGDAEAEAKSRVGRTATSTAPGQPALHFKIGDRVRITPIVPREHEQTNLSLMEDAGECFVFQMWGSRRRVDIPKSFIEKIHRFGNTEPALVQLSGRLQWVSAKRDFRLFPDKPPAGPTGEYGIGKDVDYGYPNRLGIAGRFAREDRLPEILGRGWHIFYDLGGTYLRLPGHDVDQILVCDWV